MKTFQDIEIAREMQNMIGHPQLVIKLWRYQFTREDFYTLTNCAGAVGLFVMKQNPKNLRSYLRPPLASSSQQRRNGICARPSIPMAARGTPREGRGGIVQNDSGFLARQEQRRQLRVVDGAAVIQRR